MRTIEIRTGTQVSRICIGEKLNRLKNYLPLSKSVILTDENVFRLYSHDFPDLPVIVIGTAEKNKTLQVLELIFDKLIEFEADRSSFLVAIGGGIVCDVAGFAASIYMRGIRFGFVSTTLLSQADASVGGKNGINFRGFKNMIGVINQPEFVICDTSMLKTLDDKEFKAGFAEIVKAAAIKDNLLFSYIEENVAKALAFDEEALNKLIQESIFIKAKVVEADERESGERRLLNFGHTFAHSFEKLTGMLHGEAVSVGMVLASKLSAGLGMISETDAARVKTLLTDFSLPVSVEVDMSDVFSAMRKDKKREGGSLHLVLLENIGKAVTKKIPLNQVEEMVHDLGSNL